MMTDFYPSIPERLANPAWWPELLSLITDAGETLQNARRILFDLITKHTNYDPGYVAAQLGLTVH